MKSIKLMATFLAVTLIFSGLAIVSFGMNSQEPEIKSQGPTESPLASGVPRMVLMEDYTEWGCSPCAGHNPDWTAAINAKIDKVAPAYVHVWWPTAATDPIFQYCDADNSVHDRVNFYGFSGVPSAYVDGLNTPTHMGQAAYEAMIDEKAAVLAPLSIDTSGFIDTGGNTATINARIEAALPMEAADYRVIIYLWENSITRTLAGDAPPYPNGETVLDWAVWDIVPNGQGTAIWQTGAAPGDYVDVSYTVPIGADWVVSELGATIFVQNYDNQEVENAAVEDFQNPMISLISPDPELADQELSGSVSIDWTAIDTQDTAASLDISLDYSLDGGTSWNPIMSGTNNNNPPYSWDTVASGAPDSPSYWVRVLASDADGNDGFGMLSRSMEYFSIDNTLDDRWYMQVENNNLAPHLDLDMSPSERGDPAEQILDILAPGEYPVQTFASEYVSPDLYDIGGAWNFQVSAKVSDCNPNADGNLYANIYGDDGAVQRLITTTAYDDELVGALTSFHDFAWTEVIPADTWIFAGEHVVIEIMLHATSGSGTALYYQDAFDEIPIKGTVTGDFTLTQASDDTYETINELAELEIPLYVEGFEGDGTPTFAELGWTTGGASNDWQIGTPAGLGGSYGSPDPVGAYHDTFSIGNDLTGLGTNPGDYESNLNTDSNWIYSPAVDCTGYTGVQVYFMKYLGVEQPAFDHAYIEASNNGASWTEIWTNADTVEDSDWVNTSYDISGVADGQATVYVRFEMGDSDAGWEYCGWNIDDFMITGKVSGSSLDHIWTIEVPSGESPYDFSLEAFRPNSPDADDFVFSYSEDSFVYTDMVVVNSPTESVYTYVLPPTLAGTVYIRVMDTDRTLGNNDISGLSIDELFITSTSPSQFSMGYDHYLTPSYVEPPVFILSPDNAPVVTLLTPNPVLTNQILSGNPYIITWTATDNEDPDNTLDVKVEYSTDGGASWVILEDGTDNNDGSYSWDTTLVPDGVNVLVRVSASDSIHSSHKGTDTTIPISIDNVADDQWFLQIQQAGAFEDLDMKPVELAPNTIITPVLDTLGVYMIGTWETTSTYTADITGPWTFNIYGYVDEAGPLEGYLYAVVKDGSGITLDTTVNDDENIEFFTTSHMFTWTDTLTGTLTATSLRVEIWIDVQVSGGGPSQETYVPADAAVAATFYDTSGMSASGPSTGVAQEFQYPFTALQETDASTPNDIWAISVDPGSFDEIFTMCEVTTTADPATITQIDMTFEGQGNAGTDFDLWALGSGGWAATGDTITCAAGTDGTLTGSITVSPGSYVIGGVFTWGCYQIDSSDLVRVDHLETVISTVTPYQKFVLEYDYGTTQSSVEPTVSTGGPSPEAYNIDLSAYSPGDWAFVSFPIDISGPVGTVLDDSIFGDGGTTWDAVKWYDSSDPADPWKTYRNVATDDLLTIDNTMGVWIHLVTIGVGNDLTTGLEGLEVATEVTLIAGWNLVGYASTTSVDADISLFGTGANFIAVYNGAVAYLIQDIAVAPAAHTMAPGNAYWIQVPAGTTWTA